MRRTNEPTRRPPRRLLSLGLAGALALTVLPASVAAADDPQLPDLETVCVSGSAAFPDVPAGSTHADAIACLRTLGVTLGFSDGTYRPRERITRDQVASLVAATIEQVRPLPSGGPRFDDVTSGPHADAISKLAAARVVLGRDAATFDPRSSVTRGQLASFVARAIAYVATGDAQAPDVLASSPLDRFPDVAPTSTHAGAIAALAGAGVIGGFADGTFRPLDDVRRDQMATFLVGALETGVDLQAPLVRLLGDVDRDGVVTAADAPGRDAWTEERGAIMLANLDDHAERCEMVDADGVSLSDDELTLCFDAADDVVNGERDLDDLAPLRIEVSGGSLPDGAVGTLGIEPATMVNVFLADEGGWVLIDDAHTFDAGELTAGVDLRIEATDIVRDVEVWDGFVDLHLDVSDGDEPLTSDHLVIRVAPLLFVNNTMPLQQLIIAEHPAPPAQRSFGVPNLAPELDMLGDPVTGHATAPTAGLEAAAAGDGGPSAAASDASAASSDVPAAHEVPSHWPAGFADFRADLRAGLDALGHPEDFIELDTGTDKWIQDMFEPAYMSMPAADGGEHRMRVYLRTPNQSRSGFREGRPLREGGRALFAQLRGPGTAVVQQWDPSLLTGTNARHPQDTFNSGGNFEAAPPFVHPDGREFPAGRMIFGARPPYQADPSFLKMLDGQGYQDPIRIDTSFLRVGHTDEIFTFLPSDNDRGWVLGVADARFGTRLLQEMVDDGLGDERLVNDVEELGGRVALGDLTVQQALFNSELRLGQTQATLGVDAALAVLTRELGLTEDDIVRLPALFRDPGGSTGNPPRTGLYAYLPGVANGISTGTGGFLSPKQHGPQRDGVDVFQQATEEVLGEHGIEVAWVEDWVYAHQGTGEIHCVTNAKRDLTVTEPWWQQTVSWSRA